ncbi:sensor histidine kinase [Kitasatospora paracochleata]|uniref:Signal transduction histidine kinase n=1 Tax=Kitasatospora paracochleata TaxID=58354 RepID=A0ABT1IZU9_9ACTN|nr:sensor histidine kinase [Kitasatospora paracochleata]MCP2310653.1 signal transduction histidine kinase [Kitasatospora paracochleata]
MRRPLPPAADPDAGWLAAVMRLAFLLLLGTSLIRYFDHHLHSALTPWVIGATAALAGVHLRGRAERRPAWLAGLLALWAVLVLMAPSFAWCAVPLIYTVLRALPARTAIPLVTALTALVVLAELRLADGFDPTLPLLPPAVAALATAVFLYMERQSARQRALIVDLITTRRALAATERRAGALAERERLSAEIHDTLAQGLSSQQMLLQAADRTWESDPATARGHVRTATSIAARNLAEARRFVHDLTPADLAEQGSLDAALQALSEREATESGLPVRFHLDGAPMAMPTATESALLRIAQGALANVREHAGASTAAITLSFLGDQVVLDIADDGCGFAPPESGPTHGKPTPALAEQDTPADEQTGAPTESRGHGLPAMRARLRQLGGNLTVESALGEGTVVSAAVPLASPGAPAPRTPDRRPSSRSTPTAPTAPSTPGGRPSPAEPISLEHR